MIGKIFKNNRQTWDSKKYQVLDWPSAGPGTYRGWPMDGPRKSYRKTFFRFTVALAVLAVLLALRELPNPLGARVQENLRYILTTEWNFQPMLQKAVQIGLQMVNENYPFYGDLVGENREESREALGRGSLSEDLLIPVSGKVVRGFGWSADPLDGLERFHSGIDIQASPGTPVKAARSGKVARTGKDPSLGYFILLDHGEEIYTMYAGLAPGKLVQGETVQAGQVIGEVGTAGDVRGGGLHFELREKSKLVDPLTRLKVSGN
ncbi:MAG: M23 family metallopeptidase [Armatimonadetes bacterium]|nr:M23 family metallopeptidase [Armatimonadota bacterium]